MIEKFSSFIINNGKSDNITNTTKDYIIFDIGSRDCLQSIEFYPMPDLFIFLRNPCAHRMLLIDE